MVESGKQSWLEKEQFINLTTFCRNGQAVATPVWFVWWGERLYVYTEEQSGKAKRIRANGKALIAPSDWRGNPQAAFVPASGKVLQDADTIRRVDAQFSHKYGLQRKFFDLMGRLNDRRRKARVFLELELKAEEFSG